MSGTVFQFDWEIRLMEWLQSIVAANPFMIYIIKAITQFGEPVFSALIIAYIYWNHDKRKGMRIAVDVLGTMIVNNQIKNIFDRMRPYMTNETIECLYPVDPDYPLDDIFRQGYSFPSGHTMNATSVFGGTLLKVFSTDQEVIRFGLMRLSIICTMQFFSCWMSSPSNVARAMGHSLFPMVNTITCVCVFRVVWILTIFRANRNLKLLYASYPITWVLAATVGMIYYLHLRKKLFVPESTES